MFCCKGREKRNENDIRISKKEMVERYILQTCKQKEEDSFDQSYDRMEVKIVDYDCEKYEKVPWSAAQWHMMIVSKPINQIDKDELRRNLRIGILKNLRPSTWFWISDINNTQIKKHNADIYYKLKSYQSYQDGVIFKDLKGLDKKFSNSIFDIGRAYANYDVEYGYCSGMHKIIEYVSQQLDYDNYQNLDYSFNNQNRINDYQDISIFWICVHIFIQLNMRQLFHKQISFIENDKFNNTLMPCVIGQLNKFNKPLNQLFNQPLLLLFMKSLKKQDFDKLFDVYLYEGENMLQQILLKLIKISENVIVMFQSVNDLSIYLNQTMIPYGISQIQRNNQSNFMNILLL